LYAKQIIKKTWIRILIYTYRSPKETCAHVPKEIYIHVPKEIYKNVPKETNKHNSKDLDTNIDIHL